jgi:hypothetical protein
MLTNQQQLILLDMLLKNTGKERICFYNQELIKRKENFYRTMKFLESEGLVNNIQNGKYDLTDNGYMLCCVLTSLSTMPKEYTNILIGRIIFIK